MLFLCHSFFYWNKRICPKYSIHQANLFRYKYSIFLSVFYVCVLYTRWRCERATQSANGCQIGSIYRAKWKGILTLVSGTGIPYSELQVRNALEVGCISRCGMAMILAMHNRDTVRLQRLIAVYFQKMFVWTQSVWFRRWICEWTAQSAQKSQIRPVFNQTRRFGCSILWSPGFSHPRIQVPNNQQTTSSFQRKIIYKYFF